MLLEFIVLSVIGIVFLIIGWLIWKWEKINLIHNYHYENVAEADKKAYTALMGKGAVTIGIGIILTGIIDFITQTGWGDCIWRLSYRWIGVYGLCRDEI